MNAPFLLSNCWLRSCHALPSGHLKLDNTSYYLHGDRYAALDEDHQHALGDESAFDEVTQVAEGCAISIKESFAFSAAFTFIGEAEDACNDDAGEVSTAATAMAASAENAARPEDASSTEHDKECQDAMDQEKVRVEG